MPALKYIKEWILKKSHSTGNIGTGCKLRLGITPNSIPDFVIPCPSEQVRDDNILCDLSKELSQNSSCPGLRQIPESEPDSPDDETKLTLLYREKTLSLDFLEATPSQTNADPLSKAAVSLPHFRSNTSYGFTTLNQAPHTNRKESLFHAGCSNLILNDDVTKLLVMTTLTQNSYCNQSENASKTQTPPSAFPESDNGISNRETIKKTFLSPPKPNYCRRQRKGKTESYYRRRSSALGTDCSSISSDDSVNHGLENEGQLFQPSLASFSRPVTPTSQLDEPITRKAIESGEIKFAFQFLAASKMFKVSIIKAENLGGVTRIDPNINSYCKVCLKPGKHYRQTTIVRQNRNPIYNQELAFNSFSLDQLHSKVLEIKIFNKDRCQKHPEFLGRVCINLEHYDLMIENRMWKDIDSKREREDLGCVDVSLLFQPRDSHMIVYIKGARALSWHQTVPPDPYVKVDIRQPNKSVFRKHTKTKKKTYDPDFDETFQFSISPRLDDIAYTNLVLSVYSHEKLKSDELVGQIKLGADGLQEKEMELWEKCINTPGTEVSGRLYLQNAD